MRASGVSVGEIFRSCAFAFALFLTACGNDQTPPTPSLSLFAGNMASNGSADGVGAAARFDGLQSVATDSAGNVYVADTNNHTIRKITPAGVVYTLAGTAHLAGSTDATGPAARFNSPRGIATDSAGNVYVADTLNYTIRKITPAAVVTTLAGTAGAFGATDATGAAARFNSPSGVATDSAGNVYVGDTGNLTVRKITPAGEVSTLAGTAGASGGTDATGAAARFTAPMRLATDGAGNVYVADWLDHAIRKITPAGVVTTFAGKAGAVGSADGTGAAARFFSPTDVAVDGAGNVYVADWGNDTIRKITPAGAVSTLAGVPGQQQSFGTFMPGPLPGVLFSPVGIALSGTSLYIACSEAVAVLQNLP
jgi:hypothetical protein